MIEVGAVPTFQTYAVHAHGHFECRGPAVTKTGPDAVKESASCTCCLSEFDGSDTVAVLPYGHVFCEPCIAAWASSCSNQSSKCPLCRLTFDSHAESQGLGA
eukprot:symbB.v1.2.004958.t1/scaffold272.1/size248367/13